MPYDFTLVNSEIPNAFAFPGGKIFVTAGLTRDPFVISVDKRTGEFQRALKFHTTADWDYRVREEIKDAVPPIMAKWLKRVRGY